MPFKQLWCRDTLHKHSGTRLHVPNVMLSDDPIPSQTYVKLLVLSRPPLTSALPERGDRSASCGRASEALAPCPTHSAQLRAQTVFFLGGVRLSNNPYTRVNPSSRLTTYGSLTVPPKKNPKTMVGAGSLRSRTRRSPSIRTGGGYSLAHMWKGSGCVSGTRWAIRSNAV
jgi:hypothetical protein